MTQFLDLIYQYTDLYTISFLLLAAFLYQLVIKPIYRIHYIKKCINDDKNVDTLYYPLIGGYKNIMFPKTNDTHQFMRDKVKDRPEMKAIVSNFASRAYIAFFDTDLIRELLIDRSNVYTKFTLLVFSDFLFGRGLDEKQLKSRREIFAPVFHFEQLKQKIPIIYKTSQELAERVDQEIKDKKPVHIIKQMQKATGDLLVRAFFGEEFVKKTLEGKCISLEVADILEESAQITKTNPYAIIRNLVFNLDTEHTPMFLFTKREKDLVRRMTNLKNLMKNEMINRLNKFKQSNPKTEQQQQTEKEEKEDLLYVYIKAFFDTQMKQKQTKVKLQFEIDFEFVMQQFMTVYVAGMDTTAHSSAMALYMLSKNPSCQDKLRQQINDLNIVTEEGINYEKLKECEYLQGVINETLRHYTPAPSLIPRIADKDHKIGNIHIKKGTYVDVMLISCMNNPKYFPQPELFDPERWIRKDQPFKVNPFSFIPFNAGPRNCLGQHLAIMEMKIYIVKMIHSFKVYENKEQPLVMISKPLYGAKYDDIINLEPVQN